MTQLEKYRPETDLIPESKYLSIKCPLFCLILISFYDFFKCILAVRFDETFQFLLGLPEFRTRVPTLIKRPVDGSDWDDDDGATLENAWKNEIDSEAESEGSGPDNHLK